MKYHHCAFLFIFIVLTAVALEVEEQDGWEKRIGYEDGKITSVTVYTGDTKPTSGVDTGTVDVSQQQGNYRPRPGNGRPGHKRPFRNHGSRRTISDVDEE
uniref:Uncharacterized protein n=1 Tax=Graphocephala atropunctata TaxID=36148 RepID=A0A1B6L3U0_9HEMI